MPSFSSLPGLEVPEKFVVEVPEVIWWDGFQVTTMSNLNKVAFELLRVELRWVLTILEHICQRIFFNQKLYFTKNTLIW